MGSLNDGPINGKWFRTYVEKVLAPTQRPGDIVILDNLGAHKVAGVRAAVDARGARLLYLPPYSPDLNPIEQLNSSAAAHSHGGGIAPRLIGCLQRR